MANFNVRSNANGIKVITLLFVLKSIASIIIPSNRDPFDLTPFPLSLTLIHRAAMLSLPKNTVFQMHRHAPKYSIIQDGLSAVSIPNIIILLPKSVPKSVMVSSSTNFFVSLHKQKRQILLKDFQNRITQGPSASTNWYH